MLCEKTETGEVADPEQEQTQDESKSDCSHRPPPPPPPPRRPPPLPLALASFLVTFQLGFAMAALNPIEMVIIKCLLPIVIA